MLILTTKQIVRTISRVITYNRRMMYSKSPRLFSQVHPLLGKKLPFKTSSSLNAASPSTEKSSSAAPPNPSSNPLPPVPSVVFKQGSSKAIQPASTTVGSPLPQVPNSRRCNPDWLRMREFNLLNFYGAIKLRFMSEVTVEKESH